MFRKAGSAVAALSLVVSVVVLATSVRLAVADMEALAARDPAVAPPDPATLGAAPALFRDELSQPDTLGVGRVARNVPEHLPELDAMARWLDDRIASVGFARARPVVARDNAEMLEFLRLGIVDVVSETPLSAMHFVKSAGATILLHEIRDGGPTYDSVVFVRKDSSIRTLADLRSRRIAFEDPGSTTAFLLPLASFKRAGLAMVELGGSMQPPPEGSVGYFFAQSESSIVTAVTRKVADAGALSNEEWEDLAKKNPEAAAVLEPIWESDEIPRAFVVAGPSLAPAQREKLARLLVSMHDDEDGETAMERYNDVKEFRALDGEYGSALARLEETYTLVDEEIAGDRKGAD